MGGAPLHRPPGVSIEIMEIALAAWHPENMENTDPVRGGPPGSPAYPVTGDVGHLITEVANGEREAFKELYRSTGGMLLAVIVRIVRDRHLSEEVLHECFTFVWTNAHSFDSNRGTGTAWLVTLARRRAIDCVRSVESQRARDATHAVNENTRHRSTEAHSQVETEVERRIDSAVAATALRTLPEEQSRALALVYYEGLTHEQAAQRIGIPLGTVKTRIREGLKKLRKETEAVR